MYRIVQLYMVRVCFLNREEHCDGCGEGSWMAGFVVGLSCSVLYVLCFSWLWCSSSPGFLHVDQLHSFTVGVRTRCLSLENKQTPIRHYCGSRWPCWIILERPRCSSRTDYKWLGCFALRGSLDQGSHFCSL